MRIDDFRDLGEQIESRSSMPAFGELVRLGRRRRVYRRAGGAGVTVAAVAIAALAFASWPVPNLSTAPTTPLPTPSGPPIPTGPDIPGPNGPTLDQLAYSDSDHAVAIWDTRHGSQVRDAFKVVATSNGWDTSRVVRSMSAWAYPDLQPLPDGSFAITSPNCDEPYLVEPDGTIVGLHTDTSRDTTLGGGDVLLQYMCLGFGRFGIGVLDPGTHVIRPLPLTPGVRDRAYAQLGTDGRIWVLGQSAADEPTLAWSDDGGLTWRHRPVPSAALHPEPGGLAVLNGRVAALALDGREDAKTVAMLVTTDDGDTWTTVEPVPFRARGAAAVPTPDGRLLVLDSTGSLWMSDDSWTSFDKATQLRHPDDYGSLWGTGDLLWSYSPHGDGNPVLSVDGGMSWQVVDLPPP